MKLLVTKTTVDIPLQVNCICLAGKPRVRFFVVCVCHAYEMVQPDQNGVMPRARIPEKISHAYWLCVGPGPAADTTFAMDVAAVAEVGAG